MAQVVYSAVAGRTHRPAGGAALSIAAALHRLRATAPPVLALHLPHVFGTVGVAAQRNRDLSPAETLGPSPIDLGSERGINVDLTVDELTRPPGDPSECIGRGPFKPLSVPLGRRRPGGRQAVNKVLRDGLGLSSHTRQAYSRLRHRPRFSWLEANSLIIRDFSRLFVRRGISYRHEEGVPAVAPAGTPGSKQSPSRSTRKEVAQVTQHKPRATASRPPFLTDPEHRASVLAEAAADARREVERHRIEGDGSDATERGGRS